MSWSVEIVVTPPIAKAFDHVVESFRNDLFAGYKTGDGIDPELWHQFPLAERVAFALGIVVWPMVEFEADDALATGAARWSRARSVERILLIPSSMIPVTRCQGNTKRRPATASRNNLAGMTGP